MMTQRGALGCRVAAPLVRLDTISWQSIYYSVGARRRDTETINYRVVIPTHQRCNHSEAHGIAMGDYHVSSLEP